MRRLYEKLQDKKDNDEILEAFGLKKGKRKIQKPYFKKKKGFFE